MKLETATAYTRLRSSGKNELYFVEVEGRDFLFRPLTYSEYELVCDLEKYLEGPYINDTILRMCILYTDFQGGLHEYIEKGKCMSIDKLAQVILDCSGFQNQEHFVILVHKARQSTLELDSIMQMYSCAIFKISPEEYNNMTLEEQIKYFTMAEQIAGQHIDLEGILGTSSEGPPVPNGMSSIDFLNDPELADIPEF